MERHPLSNTVFDPNLNTTQPLTLRRQSTGFHASSILDRILSAVVRTSENRQNEKVENQTESKSYDIVEAAKTVEKPASSLSTRRGIVENRQNEKVENQTEAKSNDIIEAAENVEKPASSLSTRRVASATSPYREKSPKTTNEFYRNHSEFFADSIQLKRKPGAMTRSDRESEIDRIYGPGKAGESVRRRMAGTFLENPEAEPFGHMVEADISETQTGEWLTRQYLRRDHVSNRLESDKNAIINRGAEVQKELEDVRAEMDELRKAMQEIKPPKSSGYYKLNKPRVTMADNIPEAPEAETGQSSSAYPTGIGAAGRKALANELIKHLPSEQSDFDKRTTEYEKKFYSHNVKYKPDAAFGPNTFEPWQQENAAMIRKLVYEIIELIMNAYEGEKKKGDEYLGGSGDEDYDYEEESEYEDDEEEEEIQTESGQRSRQKKKKKKKKKKSTTDADKPSVGEVVGHQKSGAADTSASGKYVSQKTKDKYEERSRKLKERAAKLKKKNQFNEDIAMLEKIAQLESDMTMLEVSKMMVTETSDELIELTRISQDFARSACIKIAWALSNPASASRGAAPQPKRVLNLQKVYANFSKNRNRKK